MKSGLIVKLKAQLTVALIACAITQTSAILLSLAVDLSGGAVPPTALVLYGAATVLLAYRWVLLTHAEHSTQRFDSAMLLLKDARRA